MIKVTRNSVELVVYSWTDYLIYVKWANKEDHISILLGKMPESANSLGLFLYPSLTFDLRYKQVVIIWPSTNTTDSILKFAGHDVTKIDYAVPQPWWDEYRAKYGKPPMACWSYETGSIFGNPLFFSDVHNEIRRFVSKALISVYDNLLSGQRNTACFSFDEENKDEAELS
jgi:hypothetical protein